MKKVITIAAMLMASIVNAGTYLEAQLGGGAYNIKNLPGLDKGHVAAGLRIGHLFAIKDSGVGLELGLTGSSTTGDVKYRQSVADLSAVANMKVSEKANVFVKAGAARVTPSLSNSVVTLTGDTKTHLRVAVGGSYNLSERLAVTATAVHLAGNSVTKAGSNSGLIGLRYTF